MSNCIIDPILEKKYGKEVISYIYDYNGKEDIDLFFSQNKKYNVNKNVFDVYSPILFTPNYYKDNGHWFMYYKLLNNIPLTLFERNIYNTSFDNNIEEVKKDIDKKRLSLKTLIDPLFEEEIMLLETFNQAKELIPYKEHFFKKLNDESDLVQYVSQIYTKEFKDFFGDWQNESSEKSVMINDDNSPQLAFHINTTNDEEFLSIRNFLHKNSVSDIIANKKKYEDRFYRVLVKDYYYNFNYSFTELTKKLLEAFPTNKEKYEFLMSRISPSDLLIYNISSSYYKSAIKRIVDNFDNNILLEETVEDLKQNLDDANSSLKLFFSNDLLYINELYKELLGIENVYYIYPAFLNIRKPFTNVDREIHNKYIQELITDNPNILVENDAIIGLEGVYEATSKDEVWDYIIFDSTQIKSLFNNGEYNKENPNIYYKKIDEKVFGFITSDNIIFIDKSTLDNPNVMFHEFYHLFDKILLENSKTNTKEKIIIDKANSLVKEYGFLDKVQKDLNYKNLSLEVQLIEARAQMIGDFAEGRFKDKTLINKVKQLINNIYNYIKSLFKNNILDSYTPEQIFSMNMYDFNNVIINTMLNTDKSISNNKLFDTLKDIFEPFYKEIITDYEVAKDIIEENDKLKSLQFINSLLEESKTNHINITIDIRLGTKWNLPYEGKVITDLVIYANEIKNSDNDKYKAILDSLYELIINNNPLLKDIPVLSYIDKRDVVAGAASDLSFEDISYFISIGNSALNMPVEDRDLMTEARHAAHKKGIYNINFVLSPYTSNKILKLGDKETLLIDKIKYKEYLINLISKKEDYNKILKIKDYSYFKNIYDSLDYNFNLKNVLDYGTQNNIINLLGFMPNDKSDINEYFSKVEYELKSINNKINTIQDKWEKAINKEFIKYLDSININSDNISLDDYYLNKEFFNLQLLINTNDNQYNNIYNYLFKNINKWNGYKNIDKTNLSTEEVNNLAITEFLKNDFKNTKKVDIVNYANEAKDYMKSIMNNFKADKDLMLINILNDYKVMFTLTFSTEKDYNFTQPMWTNIFNNIPLKTKGNLISEIEYSWRDSNIENILDNKNIFDNIYFNVIEDILGKDIVFDLNYILSKRIVTLKNLLTEEIEYINKIIVPIIDKKLQDDNQFKFTMLNFMKNSLKKSQTFNVLLGKDNKYYSNIKDINSFLNSALTDNTFINYLESIGLLEDIYTNIYNNVKDNTSEVDYKELSNIIASKLNNIKTLKDNISLIKKYPENLQFSNEELVINNDNINFLVNFDDIGYKISSSDNNDNIIENLSTFADKTLTKFKDFNVNIELNKLNSLGISIEDWNLLTQEEQNNILYCH
ncbi:MAG TPA: hypothetical protein PKD00_00345 [Burkholderiales bacterium]|nr:hypothetical protein [Burkholderiales bacterium]